MRPAPAPATRNGEPAYLKAPPRKTQAMYDLERRLAIRRAEFRALQSAAEQCDEPVNVWALLMAIGFCVIAWIVCLGCIYLLGGF